MSEASCLASVAVTLPPTKIHRGFSMLKRPKCRALLAVEALLLEERQQACHQVQLQVVALGSFVEVEDLVVLAEAIAVEVAVGVVEQRALGVQIVSFGLPLTACPKVAEYSNEKPSRTGHCVRASTPPLPRRLCRGALVHQHQVVAFEGVDGDGLVAHLVAQPGDFEDLDRLPGEQPAPVLVEQLGFDARRLKLAQVLLGQAFVGRQQQDAVQFPPPAVLFRPAGTGGCWRASKRLAATGRPSSKASLLSCDQASVVASKAESGRPRACPRCSWPPARSVPPAAPGDHGSSGRDRLSVNSRVRYWKYFQTIGSLAARDASLVQPLCVPDDVLVVLEQQVRRQLCQIEELRRQCMVEVVDVVLVQTFEALVRRCSARSSKRLTLNSDSSHWFKTSFFANGSCGCLVARPRGITDLPCWNRTCQVHSGARSLHRAFLPPVASR
jgi:hypothetical protein